MVDKWNSNSGESGILRKTTHQYRENRESPNLLVFGYACKIFRDDEKARNIDQGKHLIPWMGSESHKIDRYDVRATLHELAPYEPPPGGFTNRLDYLSPAEQRAEQLCEEERYYSLYHNDVEEEVYQEEELKRLHQLRSSSMGQVAFDYDNPSTSKSNGNGTEESTEPEEPDEVFTAPSGFYIPANIVVPTTMKEHAIIEKTARFISTQGPQMEILIKAKQSNNPQFEFLMQTSNLFKYYRYVLDSIKEGTFPVHIERSDDPVVVEPTENSGNGVDSTPQSNDNTSMASSLTQSIRSSIPTIAYKPSADCAYTQLISKIKGVPLPMVSQIVPPPVVKTLPPPERTDFKQNKDGVEVNQISSGLMLAQYYNTDSETDHSGNEEETVEKPTTPKESVISENPAPAVVNLNFPVPEENLKNIIDKTATYVIKNGKSFEEILIHKDRQRFSFLSDSSEYHYYYLYKVTGKVPPIKDKSAEQTNDSKIKGIVSVSFSIKPKDEQSIPSKHCLPQDNGSSGDEDHTQASESPNLLHPPPITQTIPSASTHVEPIVRSLEAEKREKDAKRIAGEKLRDRLAAAAREKLGMLSKEKQLQLERKKKALAFLNQIKVTSTTTTVKPPVNDDEETITPITSFSTYDDQNESDGGESIHSIPTMDSTSSPEENAVDPESRKSRSKTPRSRSQSLTRSRSRSHSRSSRSKSKHKKKKSKSKKKSKRKSRSRSRESTERRKYRKTESSHRSRY